MSVKGDKRRPHSYRHVGVCPSAPRIGELLLFVAEAEALTMRTLSGLGALRMFDAIDDTMYELANLSIR